MPRGLLPASVRPYFLYEPASRDGLARSCAAVESERWKDEPKPPHSSSIIDRMTRQDNPLALESVTKATLQRWRVPMGFVTAALFVIFSRPSWRSLAVGAPISLGGAAI